jgi:hypothetical protein
LPTEGGTDIFFIRSLTTRSVSRLYRVGRQHDESRIGKHVDETIRVLMDVLFRNLLEGTEEYRDKRQDSQCLGWDSNPALEIQVWSYLLGNLIFKSELLGFWTLSIVRYSRNYKTQRFGNWLCFRLQVRGRGRHLLSWVP